MRIYTSSLVVLLTLATASVFAQQQPQLLRIHLLSGAVEYESEKSLREFGAHLEKHFQVQCSASWSKDGAEHLEHLEELEKADLLVVYARRLKLVEEDMRRVRNHWEQGKPVVGIRTASHAFQQADNEHFDREVLGSHYLGHYGQEDVQVENVIEQGAHAILKTVKPFVSRRLYKMGPLAKDAVVLQTGDIATAKQPVTVTHVYKGARMFYTSLGVPEDFQNAEFRRLLENAILWTSQRESLRKPTSP